MIFDTSNSLKVDFVTGGSTGKDWWREAFLECLVTTGSGVGVDDAETPEEFSDNAEAAGVVDRKAGSHRRGDSCDVDWALLELCGSSCGACCIWTSVSCICSASLLGLGADVERFLRDLSTGPPVSCSGTML